MVGLLRSSEICALRAADIRLVRDELGGLVAVQVRIVTSKTAEHLDEATGGVQHVTIARRPDACDVVVPLLEWMEALGMLSPGRQLVQGREKDYLFPARQGSSTPIAKVMISEALRAGLVAIGMDEAMIASYSGRSLRAGGATDMRDSGVPWHVIVMQGRWRSDAWKKYFRESADVAGHLLLLQPVALDALRYLPPTALAAADAQGRETARLPTLPTVPLGAVPSPTAQGHPGGPAPREASPSGVGAETQSGLALREWKARDERLAFEIIGRVQEVTDRPSLLLSEWKATTFVWQAVRRLAGNAYRDRTPIAATRQLMLETLDEQAELGLALKSTLATIIKGEALPVKSEGQPSKEPAVVMTSVSLSLEQSKVATATSEAAPQKGGTKRRRTAPARCASGGDKVGESRERRRGAGKNPRFNT